MLSPNTKLPTEISYEHGEDSSDIECKEPSEIVNYEIDCSICPANDASDSLCSELSC